MKKAYKIITLALTSLVITSCLKDDLYTGDTELSPYIIEFQAAPDQMSEEGLIYPMYSQSFEFVDEDEMAVTISYSGKDPAPSDINLNVQLDPTSLATYNEKAGEEIYTLAPSTFFSIPSNDLVIKKGERTAEFIIKVFPKKMDYEAEYVIPLVIKSAQGAPNTLSGNFGTALFQVIPRNQYDGVYTATGSSVRQGDPVLSGSFPEQTYSLITTGANTVRMNRVAVWGNGSNIGGIGNFYFEIDPVTKAVTVSDNVNPAVKNNPADPNVYDMETKTLKMSAYWGSGPLNRAFKADFKYKNPRP